MKPSDFIIYPWSSVAGKAESETIALNIMKILKRTGNEFRDLSFDEYKEERLKDGNYSDMEKPYFDSVIKYCKSESSARSFSKSWCK